MACLLFILISVLALNFQSEARTEVREKVYIVESKWTANPTVPPEKLVLICNVSEEEEASVYWEKDQELKGIGKELEITVKEPLDAGNYSCWNNDTHKLISFTAIYIKKTGVNGEIADPILKVLEDTKSRTFFNCTANNYSGNFKCSWISTIQDSDLHFEIVAGSRARGNIICEKPEPEKKDTGRNHEAGEVMYSVSCKKQNNCSLTEEYQATEMVLKVFHGVVYEKHSQTFLIKEILKPDTTECSINQDGLLTWKPPKTWSTPYSYYGLTYQIKMVGNKQNEEICEVTNDALKQTGDILACYIKGCQYRSCYIRSRDRYHKNSAWSKWSEKCRDESQKNDTPHIHEHIANIEPCKCRKN